MYSPFSPFFKLSRKSSLVPVSWWGVSVAYDGGSAVDKFIVPSGIVVLVETPFPPLYNFDHDLTFSTTLRPLD